MKTILSFFFLVGFFNTVAQSYKGRVTDIQQLPIEQAYIVNLETGHHQHSDVTGYFYFDDLSSYSRFIKGQTGVSPTELKAQLMEIVNS